MPGDGGAVQVDDPDARLLIDTVIFNGNDAGEYGGAVYYPDGVEASRFSIEQSEFSGNTAGDEGGALWLDLIENFPDDPTIKNSAFVGDSATQMGGAIYVGTRVIDGIFLRVDNTTISGNSATLGGGALAFDLAESGNASFNFSTIVNNTTTTPGQGGGILAASSPTDDQFVLFGTSIIAGNTAAGSSSNCAGPGNFQGGDLDREAPTTCGLIGTSMVNTDPQIAPTGHQPRRRADDAHARSIRHQSRRELLRGLAGLVCRLRRSTSATRPGPPAAAVTSAPTRAPSAPNPNPPGGGPSTPVPSTPTPATKCKKKKKKKKGKSLAGGQEEEEGLQEEEEEEEAVPPRLTAPAPKLAA